MGHRYRRAVPADHPCPVAYAVEHGFADESRLKPTWCWSTYRDVIAALPDPVTDRDASKDELLLWSDARLAMYYTPFDWVNVDARVVLVGITPGRYQARVALAEASHGLQEGLCSNEILRRVDATASFSGPMRANLVAMLDGIGVADALAIPTAAEMFNTVHHRLAAFCSAISYPVFVDGRNYRGAPSLTATPALKDIAEAVLAATVALSADALVIPLGRAAEEAVELLVAADRLTPERRLVGFPHPSGANGHRVAQYAENQGALAEAAERWFDRAGTSTDERNASSSESTPRSSPAGRRRQ